MRAQSIDNKPNRGLDIVMSILVVQPYDLIKVTKLRWDGASELIRVKGPEIGTMNERDTGLRVIGDESSTSGIQ